jgi:hypothetical protein
MSRKLIQTKKTTLSYGISDSATTIRLDNLLKLDGTAISASDIGDVLYGTFDPGTSREEIFSIASSNVTVNSDGTVDITSVVRGLQEVSPYSTGGFATDHPAGAVVIFGNNPQVYNQLAFLANDNVFTGYASGPDPISGQGFVTRDYMLALINGGTVSVNRMVVSATAGETVSAGNLVYLKLSDGFWWKADADLVATLDNVQLAIAQGAGTAGNSISGGVLLSGTDTNNTGTAGAYGYASNTAGSIGTSAGTNTFILGQFMPSSAGFYFNPAFYQLPTIAENLALGGSQGVPGTSNKYVTQDNVSTGLTDQTQTTQDSTIETGEADTTGKKNLIAQSFIPTFTKIRGFNLYKSADTGTFTGTVVVTLQADSSGSPSGVALATRTFTNVEWEGFAVGEIEGIFSSEYASMTAGSLYWLVIDPSTSDNSNHPNLGTNTAGGYTSGSVKYKNTTDGWVAVSNIDLYFKTLQGTASQVIKTNTEGKMERTMYSTSEMPIPAFQQLIPILGMTDGVQGNGGSANQDGSVLILSTDITNELFRYARDSVTGIYVMTHNVSVTPGTGATSCIQIMGNYVYLFYDSGNNISCYRYDLADLTNETSITMPAIDTAGSNYGTLAWTDGTYMYIKTSKVNTTAYKMSISGTTFSTVTTSATSNTVSTGSGMCSMFDGTNNYALSWGSSDTANIYKGADVYMSSVTTTAKLITSWVASGNSDGAMLISIDANRCYIGRFETNNNETTTIKAFMMLYPVTKP